MEETFSEYVLKDIARWWNSFGNRVLDMVTTYKESAELSVFCRVWALFSCAQQLAWLLAWFPLLVVLSLLGFTLVLIAQTFPFVAAAVVLWICYNLVWFFSAPPPPPKPPIYHPVMWDPEPLPVKAEAETP